jgi:pantoate--beta-alanine ligase
VSVGQVRLGGRSLPLPQSDCYFGRAAPACGMRIVKSVAAMQRLASKWRRAGARVGLVPTMGYLHAGHLSLARRARQSVGGAGQVVVSIFVNPTQFSPTEDFSRYPRDLARDAAMCRAEGVDVIFAPSEADMYPRGEGRDFSTFVVEENLARSMEGSSRPTHFRGVTTVVAKLFNLVQPEVAIFGAKDWQQAAIIKRMVRDLNFPLKIIVAPILREPDGLAMSSRNKYLASDLREQALVLSRAIQMAREELARSGTPIAAARLKQKLQRLIERQPAARVDYVEFFEPDTLASVKQVQHGTHMALAVFIGATRLIDNAGL